MTSLESARSVINWKHTALKAAKEADPKEACGLLLLVKGKKRYWPCKMLLNIQNKCFRLLQLIMQKQKREEKF